MLGSNEEPIACGMAIFIVSLCRAKDDKAVVNVAVYIGDESAKKTIA